MKDKDIKKNNIILIGMPGVGKSTIGVVLAKKMGFRFVDSDLVIQEQEGRLLHELIEEYGQSGFLEIENRVNASLLVEKAVIATGGSVVYGKEAMAHLKKIGIIVYLYLPYEGIESRLGDLGERGVAIAPGQSLKDLFNERKPMYEEYAQITVCCEDKEIREIVEEIGELIHEKYEA